MYSYEDRIRAVKLYVKLGKRLRATTPMATQIPPLVATSNSPTLIAA